MKNKVNFGFKSHTRALRQGMKMENLREFNELTLPQLHSRISIIQIHNSYMNFHHTSPPHKTHANETEFIHYFFQLLVFGCSNSNYE